MSHESDSDGDWISLSTTPKPTIKPNITSIETKPTPKKKDNDEKIKQLEFELRVAKSDLKDLTKEVKGLRKHFRDLEVMLANRGMVIRRTS
jgi:hypothetical protein